MHNFGNYFANLNCYISITGNLKLLEINKFLNMSFTNKFVFFFSGRQLFAFENSKKNLFIFFHTPNILFLTTFFSVYKLDVILACRF